MIDKAYTELAAQSPGPTISKEACVACGVGATIVVAHHAPAPCRVAATPRDTAVAARFCGTQAVVEVVANAALTCHVRCTRPQLPAPLPAAGHDGRAPVPSDRPR